VMTVEHSVFELLALSGMVQARSHKKLLLFKGKKGSVSIITCLLLSALLGFMALSVDVGMVYIEKARLYNAIDAAALAAALELSAGEAKARSVALEYLIKNNIDPDNTVIKISPDNKSIEIEGNLSVNHLFAPILGIYNSDVAAATKAVIGPIKTVNGGIRPFAVEIFDYTYGDVVILKKGAGDGYCGNYGTVALGGTGQSTYRNNALYGFSGTLSVGDYIDTETGNMSGAINAIRDYIQQENSTFNNFSRDSIRLWTLPLVDTLEVNGRGQVQVVGFAQFYVEEVRNSGGNAELVGRFVQYVTKGVIDMSLNDTGAYGVKLSR